MRGWGGCPRAHRSAPLPQVQWFTCKGPVLPDRGSGARLTTAPLCLHGCDSPADGESDLDVSVCALYILLVGNEFTNPLSTGNRAFPRAEQMGEKAFERLFKVASFPHSWYNVSCYVYMCFNSWGWGETCTVLSLAPQKTLGRPASHSQEPMSRTAPPGPGGEPLPSDIPECVWHSPWKEGGKENFLQSWHQFFQWG